MRFLEDATRYRIYAIMSLAIAPDNRMLATAAAYQMEGDETWKGEVALWNLDTARKQTVLHQGKGMATSVAVRPDGKYLAAYCGDGVRLWNLATGKRGAMASRSLDPGCVLFSPDMRWLTFLREGGGVTAWEIAKRTRLSPATGKPLCGAFAPDGRTLVLNDGRAVDLESGQVALWNKKIAKRKPISFGFAPDGRTLVIANGFAITVHDFPSMKRTFELEGFYRAWALSPGGTRLLCGAHRGVTLWDVAENRKLECPDFGLGLCMSVAFSSDGMTAAVGGYGENNLVMWDVV